MGGTTMAILGCGNMGTAILDGILAAIKQPQCRKRLPTQLRPSRFIACVNRAESVTRLERRYGDYLHTIGSINSGSGPSAVSRISNDSDRMTNSSPSAVVQIWQNNTAEAVKRADVILLACQPSQAAGILADTSLRQHLSRKLLLSICVGVSASQIQRLIYGDNKGNGRSGAVIGSNVMQDKHEFERCYVVHAMPNTASTLGESATALSSITTTDEGAGIKPLPTELEELAAWIFSSIGTVTYVSPALMNVASVTGASTVAFYATALQGVVNGAISMGLSEKDALQLAAQAMKGTAEMALTNVEMMNAQTWPGEIRDKVMTPNGCTARGISVLDGAKAGEAFAEATKQAVERVFELGREASSTPSG